ncbi:hypothetical protein KC330_g195 [Hortaea werneckii]|nr:hypothetical protein KC330_g195 [Hortaea werneckii]
METWTWEAPSARDHSTIGQGFSAAHGMCLAGAGDSVCEEGDIVAFEKMLDHVCLCRLLIIYTVELEGEGLCLILGVRYPHEVLVLRLLGWCARCLYDHVLLDLLLEKRPNAGDDANRHDWVSVVGNIALEMSDPALALSSLGWFVMAGSWAAVEAKLMESAGQRRTQNDRSSSPHDIHSTYIYLRDKQEVRRTARSHPTQNIAACYLDCLTNLPNKRRAFASMSLKLRTTSLLHYVQSTVMAIRFCGSMRRAYS